MLHRPPSLFPSDRELPAAWSASLPARSGDSSAAPARVEAACTVSSLPSFVSSRESVLPADVSAWVGPFLLLLLAAVAHGLRRGWLAFLSCRHRARRAQERKCR